MFLYIISVIAAGLAAFWLAGPLWDLKRISTGRRSLFGKRKERHESIFFRIFMPAIQPVSHRLVGLELKGYRSYISEGLGRAGLTGRTSVEEFWAYQLVTSAVFLLFSCIFFAFSFLTLFIAAALGFLFPVVWLCSLKKARHKEITYHLPLVLDMLTLSVEAGLDFISAASRIVEKGRRSVITVELGRMLGQIKLGKGREEALMDFKGRMSHPSIDSFVAMLLQAHRLGASIGPILAAHADKLRTDRFQLAEKAGGAAAQKMLIPLIFCIMPAVFVVIFGPLIVMWRNGTFGRVLGW